VKTLQERAAATVDGFFVVFPDAKGFTDTDLEAALVAFATAELTQANALLDAPEVLSFRDGVVLEAAHQRARWGAEHDAGKEPSAWFWLVGYLGGKALASHIAFLATGSDEHRDKALHRTIATAAALANWHAAILGKTDMRPGVAADAPLRKDVDG
jgi:hypothetical protein